MTWDFTGGNTLKHSTTATGFMPAQSEVVQVQYKVLVKDVAPGTDINNEVVVDTTNPEDDDDNNDDNSETTVPYPDLMITMDGDRTVEP